ncbi:hypothetical protein [Paenibacillus cremeus]|uniref:Uncharacterized protein n=1 Tax=Paenibacillus cremeus TaxID=2163881 RepID=A0A559K5D0_9BACL|nr:hypothetical protein [Paenibacillus cremeus]TVY07303.1 hypothetical protein FPZ49_24470 [Paenibacillus cremeus]
MTNVRAFSCFYSSYEETGDPMKTIPSQGQGKATVDFIMANEDNEIVKCSFKKLFEYNGDMYVAVEDTTETMYILRVKDPFSNTPKLVELPKEHTLTIHNFYRCLIGERPLYAEPS